MGAVIEVQTSSTDIEHEADLLSSFGEKPIGFPVDNNRSVEDCRFCGLAVQSFVSRCFTAYAERHLKGSMAQSIFIVRSM